MDENGFISWVYSPVPVLCKIFGYLNSKDLLNVGSTCKRWLEISRDELLWKDVFYDTFRVDRSVNIITGTV